MFKIFDKRKFNGNYCYMENNRESVLAVIDNGSIVKLSCNDNWEFTGNGNVIDAINNGSVVKLSCNNYWELVDRENYVVIPMRELVSENLIFQISKRIGSEYINVYRIDDYYVAYEYSALTNSYYLIKDMEEFKKDKSKIYDYISMEKRII